MRFKRLIGFQNVTFGSDHSYRRFDGSFERVEIVRGYSVEVAFERGGKRHVVKSTHTTRRHAEELA